LIYLRKSKAELIVDKAYHLHNTDKLIYNTSMSKAVKWLIYSVVFLFLFLGVLALFVGEVNPERIGYTFLFVILISWKFLVLLSLLGVGFYVVYRRKHWQAYKILVQGWFALSVAVLIYFGVMALFWVIALGTA
jgi:hypothetical protein